MSQLTDLPNIGITLSRKLASIGITTFEQLKATGSKRVIVKISTLDNSGVCINMLYALEGAIQGIRWHGLNKGVKQELKAFYYLISK